ncbi:butyrophilin subfamily 1 member A1 isoform X1 [Bombina bombina]|uniref:butyrophilin subfamily 1 member A1 isoform X1 n=1 Tax=Bombina bombina TaxID=8345 RepID=UPI00235B0477|nr:butyrophilin subfamily 1 member A1 isoform X1 [Bombina bombina]
MKSTFVYITLILMAPPVTVEFQVQSQEGVLVAEVGSDVILPCKTSQPLSAVGLEVRWFQTLFHSPVFLMIDGREEKEQQNTDFRGRASLLSGPDTGDLSLLLRKIRLTDNGNYTCFVENKTTNVYDEANVQLNTVAMGSSPLLTVSLEDKAIHLSFSSHGWYPEPKLHFEKKDGSLFTSDTKTTLNHSSGLFRVEGSILLRDSSDKNVYCMASNPGMTKQSGIYVRFSDDLFPRVSGYAYAFWFILILLLLVVSLLIYYVFRLLKVKEGLKKKVDELTLEVEWRKAVMNREFITFNPKTANAKISISPDNLILSPDPPAVKYEPISLQFEKERCCLGNELFNNGFHYWEVEVGNGLEWAVGVANPDVRKTGAYMFSPTEHIWCIARFVENVKALDNSEKTLELNDNALERVGIYLKLQRPCEVSFYNPQSWECLYTFNDLTPCGHFHPFFWVGTNGASIRLLENRCASTVEITEQENMQENNMEQMRLLVEA